jgi:peptidoglycan/LPS O-acetylase OafA/YrhL
VGVAVCAPAPALSRMAQRGRPKSSSQQLSGPVPRFRLLDGLRILAALAVVVYHFTARENSAWGIPVDQVFPQFARLSALGAFGVQLFFIISGFVILLSAWGRSVGDFAASRVGRLFPGYWAGVILTSILLLLIWPEGHDISMTQALTNLSMLQAPLGVEDVDGVYWTLWVELKFYILIGVFMLIGITKARILFVCAFWPIAAALSETIGSKMLVQLLMPEYAPLFAGGMLLFLMLREGATAPCWLLLGVNFMFAAHQATTGQFRQVQEFSRQSYPDLVCWLIIAALFAVVAAVTLTKLNRISLAGLSAAGALTFPLYLIHEYWGWWFISILNPVLPQKAVLVVAILLCLAMAWLIRKYIEAPLGPVLRRSVQAGLQQLAPPTVGGSQPKDHAAHSNSLSDRNDGTAARLPVI